MGGGGPYTADVTRQCAPGSCPTPPGGHPSVGTGRLPTAARHAPPLPAANDRQEGWRGHVGPRRGGSCSERGTGAALPLFLPLAPAQAWVGPLGGASLTGPQRHRHSLQTPYGPHRPQTGPTDRRRASQTPDRPHKPQTGPTDSIWAPQTPDRLHRPQMGGGQPAVPSLSQGPQPPRWLLHQECLWWVSPSPQASLLSPPTCHLLRRIPAGPQRLATFPRPAVHSRSVGHLPLLAPAQGVSFLGQGRLGPRSPLSSLRPPTPKPCTERDLNEVTLSRAGGPRWPPCTLGLLWELGGGPGPRLPRPSGRPCTVC